MSETLAQPTQTVVKVLADLSPTFDLVTAQSADQLTGQFSTEG
jgi:hypothetical protein